MNERTQVIKEINDIFKSFELSSSYSSAIQWFQWLCFETVAFCPDSHTGTEQWAWRTRHHKESYEDAADQWSDSWSANCKEKVAWTKALLPWDCNTVGGLYVPSYWYTECCMLLTMASYTLQNCYISAVTAWLRSIARPLCDSRASCQSLQWCSTSWIPQS